MTEKRKIPPCLGGYETNDEVCDGKGKEGPCLFHDRCVGFQLLLKDLKAGGKPSDAEHYLSTREVDGEEFAFAKGDDGKLQAAIDKRVAKYGVKDGKVTVPKGRKEKPPKKGRSASKKAPSNGAAPKAKAAGKQAEDGSDLCAWFTSQLGEKSERAVHDLPGDCETGELFIIDRTEKSNYAAVYARGEVVNKIAVASMYPNRRTRTLQIRIAAPFKAFSDSLGKAAKSALELEDYTGKDGRFHVRICGLDQEGTSIVAEAVSAAIAGGIIELPEVG